MKHHYFIKLKINLNFLQLKEALKNKFFKVQ